MSSIAQDNKDLLAVVDKDPFKMDGSPDLTPHPIIMEEIVGQGELITHGSRVVLWHMCKLHPGDITLDRSTTADGPPVSPSPILMDTDSLMFRPS